MEKPLVHSWSNWKLVCLPCAWSFAALGVYWLALIYQLGAQWSVYEQYNYGWAVPFLCVFLLWRRIQESHHRPLTTDQRLPTTKTPSPILYILFALCALLYAPTRFFHEANSIWRLTSWLWATEVVGLTLIFIHLSLRAFPLRHVRGESDATLAHLMGEGLGVRASGEVSSPSSLSEFQRFRFSDFVFPLCFFLVAVPWPSGAESFLVQMLTRLNVSTTVEVLGWFGVPALQHGNVIEVATGVVGIDEACSGIRSFQATLMISLFFGEFYRLNMARRAVCVLAGFALSFLFNMARTSLLTWVAAKKGVGAIAGWHDPAGVTILVACFLTLWLAAVWLARRKGQKVECSALDSRQSTASASSTPNAQLSTARRLAIVLLAWFVVVEAGTQLWFRLHENSAASREEWSVSVDGTNPRLTKVEISADIRAVLRADTYVEAKWHDDAGISWQLDYFRWLPAHSLNKRVAVQFAKMHSPELCLPSVGMTLKSDLGVISVPVGDMQFAFRQYVFLADGQPIHVFFGIYEDSSGSAILANRQHDMARRIAAAFAGSRNYGLRLLEIAVAGPDNAADAEAAVRGELKKLITSKP